MSEGDSAAFLTALRLSDSFLPVGAYTSSYGVEQYVNEGFVETADELGALVEAYLRRIVGPADIVALANAHVGAATGNTDRVFAADERLHAATMPAEFRTSSTKAGRQLLDLFAETDGAMFAAAADGSGVAIGPDGSDESTIPTAVVRAYADAVDDDTTPGHYAVALGVVAEHAGIGREQACLMQTYSFASGLLGAAQRLGRFGHTDIQTQLARLLSVAEEVVTEYADADLDAMCSFAPFADVMGFEHERADRRLFMS